MDPKGAEIWAKQPDLQPAHGWSDRLLVLLPFLRHGTLVTHSCLSAIMAAIFTAAIMLAGLA